MNLQISRQRVDLHAGSRYYPASIAECITRPPTLYARGNLKLLEAPQKRLAVVGSRKTTPQNQSALSLVLKPTGTLPLTIVSGLALGMDALGHEIALAHGLATIAILGSSVEDAEIYPRENCSLAQRIVKSGGLLLSPFPKGAEIRKHNFPARNQIIAALSCAVLIASAAKKSGALITARFAADYGRDVLVIPGSVTDPLYAGSNRLLTEGAMPILSHADLLSFLGIPQLRLPLKDAATSKIELLILSKLTTSAYSIDELLHSTALPPAALQAALTQLELRGVISIQPNGDIVIMHHS